MEFPIRMSELAKKLGVEISTPRRWCAMFEGEGYVFERDLSNRRVFNEQDLKLLEQFQQHCVSMKMDEALKLVLAGWKEADLSKTKEPINELQESSSSLDEFVREADQLIESLNHSLYWDGVERAMKHFEDQWCALKSRWLDPPQENGIEPPGHTRGSTPSTAAGSDKWRDRYDEENNKVR